MKRKGFLIAFLLLSPTIAAFLLYLFVYYPLYVIKDVSIREINSNPRSFDGSCVRLQGYVVETRYMFGPKYVLRDFDDQGVEIALDGKGGPEEVDLDPYVSFVFDGVNYTQIRNLRASVIGHVRYIGFVTDAPSFYLDIERVEL